MMSVMGLGLSVGGTAFGVEGGSMCRHSHGGPPAGSMAGLPSSWTPARVGTDRRCLGVCRHGQAFLCLAAPA